MFKLKSALLLPLTHPLELILQNTGDVEAEVGAERQQAVEEEHQEAVIHCKDNKEAVSFLNSLWKWVWNMDRKSSTGL